ncbi:MAG: aspartate aminotransferase family protein, partial [Gammaproteobacteria bacterium]|nr:aspartate aminotransferase family protein [Gammaproteobacteria bacterium]
ERLVDGILDAASSLGVAMRANRVGAMFGLFFTDKDAITCFSDVMGCDEDRFRRFFHGMLKRGIYLAPSAYEAGFVSIAHSQDDIDATVDAAAEVLKGLR